MSEFIDDECNENLRCEDEGEREIEEAFQDVARAAGLDQAEEKEDEDPDERDFQEWKRQQLDEARGLSNSNYRDENGNLRTYVGTNPYANESKAKRIYEEVDRHESHRSDRKDANRPRVFATQRVINDREAQKQRKRAYDLQQRREEEEKRKEDERRKRPEANDWYASTRLSPQIVKDIINRHGHLLTGAMKEEVASYCNRFISVVRTTSKITYWVRNPDARSEDPSCRLYNCYSSEKELSALLTSATTTFIIQGEKKDKKKDINPMRYAYCLSYACLRFWLEWPERNDFDRLDFVPVDHKDPAIPTSLLCPPNVFNTYEGVLITRQEAEAYVADIPDWRERIESWVQHVKEVVTGGEEQGFNFVLDWLAHILQKPWEKPLTHPQMSSVEGGGKGLFLQPMKRILGRGFLHISDAQSELNGSFNGHLANAILVFDDEATFSKDPRSRSKMKTKITEDTQVINDKFVPLRVAKSYMR